MKSFMKKNKAFSAYMIIALIAAAAGIFFGRGNELFYMLLAQYLLLPLAGFICSVCAAKKGTAFGFLSPVIFTLVATALPFLVFSSTDLVFFVFSGLPCALGLILGFIGYVISKARRASSKEKKQAKEEKLQEAEEARSENEDFSVEADNVNASLANMSEEEEDDSVPETEE